MSDQDEIGNENNTIPDTSNKYTMIGSLLDPSTPIENNNTDSIEADLDSDNSIENQIDDEAGSDLDNDDWLDDAIDSSHDDTNSSHDATDPFIDNSALPENTDFESRDTSKPVPVNSDSISQKDFSDIEISALNTAAKYKSECEESPFVSLKDVNPDQASSYNMTQIKSLFGQFLSEMETFMTEDESFSQRFHLFSDSSKLSNGLESEKMSPSVAHSNSRKMSPSAAHSNSRKMSPSAAHSNSRKMSPSAARASPVKKSPNAPSFERISHSSPSRKEVK